MNIANVVSALFGAAAIAGNSMPTPGPRPADCGTLAAQPMQGYKVCFSARPEVDLLTSLYAGECNLRCKVTQDYTANDGRIKISTMVTIRTECSRNLSSLDGNAIFDYTAKLGESTRTVLEQADTNKDGWITFTEIWALTKEHAREVEKQLCATALSVDKDAVNYSFASK